MSDPTDPRALRYPACLRSTAGRARSRGVERMERAGQLRMELEAP